MNNSITLTGSTASLIAALTAFQTSQELEFETPDGFIPAAPEQTAPVAQPEQQPVVEPVAETIQTVAPKTPKIPADREGVDSEGLPWDARIHGAGKIAKNNDGTWRAKRGVDDALVAQVKAELKANLAPPMPTGDQQPAQQPIQQPIQEQQVPPMPTGDQPTTDASQQPPTGLDFGGFMQNISLRLGDKTLDAPKLTKYAQELGLGAITDLATDPTKIDQAVQIMHRDGVWFA